MWTLVIVLVFFCGLNSSLGQPQKGGYTETSHGPGFAGAASGSFTNNGVHGAGFIPTFPYNPNAFYSPFPNFSNFPQFPTQPLLDPQDFNKILSNYLEALQKNYANLYEQQLAHQQAIYEAIRKQAVHAPANGYAPNFAGASATYGPQGVHQTATLYPANPGMPNVDSRFGAEIPVAGKPQFFGVSTSSFSESSDINGMQSNRRGAATIVNDNGKITQHTLHS